jgi:cold shock protein
MIRGPLRYAGAFNCATTSVERRQTSPAAIAAYLSQPYRVFSSQDAAGSAACHGGGTRTGNRGRSQLVTGRVLQFDQVRGYGFVAADDGGEDIFLHASVFDGDPDELAPGMRVEFQVMASDRGRKAFGAHLCAEPDPEDEPVPPPRLTPAAPPVPSPLLAQTLPAPARSAPDEEQMCDVLSQAEFRQELTELLLSNTPALTGQQILDVRQSVLEFARKHGWIDI